MDERGDLLAEYGRLLDVAQRARRLARNLTGDDRRRLEAYAEELEEQARQIAVQLGLISRA